MIPNKSFHITLTPSGIINSLYPDGNDGTAAIPLTWAAIPSSLANPQGTAVTIHIRALYLTEPGSPSATLAVVGTLPSGWSLGADDLTFSGIGSGNAAIQISATRSGFTAISNMFHVESLVAVSADTVPPTIPAGIVAVNSQSGGGVNTITFDPAMDPAIPGYLTSGLKDYRLYKDGSVAQTVASAAPGVSPLLNYADIGATGISGFATQAGNSSNAWTMYSGGTQIGGTTDAFGFLSTPALGDSFISTRISVFTPANIGSKTGLMYRESLDPGSVFLMVNVSNAGVQFLIRNATNATAANINAGVPAIPAAGLYLRLARTGNLFAAAYSLTGKNWIDLGSLNLPLATSLLVGAATNSQSSSAVAASTLGQLCLQNIAAPIFTDAGIGTVEHTYTVSARDNALNESAQSALVTVTPVVATTGSRKWSPGLWVRAENLARPGNTASTGNQTTIDRISGMPNIVGALFKYTWALIEPTKSAYDFSVIDRDITRCANAGKKMGMELWDRNFSGTTPVGAGVIPDYILNNTGIYGAGYDGTHSGWWLKTNPGGGSQSAVWRSAVMARRIALVQALAAHIDPTNGLTLDLSPNIEFIEISSETSYGLASGSDYNGATMLIQLKSLMDSSVAAWPHTIMMVGCNFAAGYDSSDLVNYAQSAHCAVGTPDVTGSSDPAAFSDAQDAWCGRVGPKALRAIDQRGKMPIVQHIEGPDFRFYTAQQIQPQVVTMGTTHAVWQEYDGATTYKYVDWTNFMKPFLLTNPSTVGTRPVGW